MRAFRVVFFRRIANIADWLTERAELERSRNFASGS